MAVLCDNCGWIGEETDLKITREHLSDDYMGTGHSFYNEYHCPECGQTEFTDGTICKSCDEFVMDGQICDCLNNS